MRARKVFRTVVVVGALAFMTAGIAMAQEQQRGPRRMGGDQPGQREPGRGPGNFDPAAMRQRMAERIKDALGVKDDAEWAVLQPRIEKVQSLLRDASGFGGMFGMRRRGPAEGPGAAGGPAGVQPQSEVAKAAQALQDVLDNEQATADQIKAKLTALREAREKAKQELAQAREALRELVTPRQEAQLVLMGILD